MLFWIFRVQWRFTHIGVHSDTDTCGRYEGQDPTGESSCRHDGSPAGDDGKIPAAIQAGPLPVRYSGAGGARPNQAGCRGIRRDAAGGVVCAKGPAAVFIDRLTDSHNAGFGTSSTSMTAKISVRHRTRKRRRTSALWETYPRCLISAASRVQISCSIVINGCFI